MATYARPGVYVTETLNPIQPIAGPSSSSIGAFVGANDRGPNAVTLVTSWSQYTSLYGSWNTLANNNLPLAVYQFFANGGGQCYVYRVAGASSTTANRTLNDQASTPLATLKLSAKNVGTWGNLINVSTTAGSSAGYFNLIVYYNGSTAGNIVEQWTDITMASSDARYAVNVINNNSTWLAATDLASASTAPTNNPAVITNQSLSSGNDGSAVTGSTIVTYAFGSPSPFDLITQSLVLNVPGYTDATTINAAISYAVGRGDVFVVIDGINDTAANQLTLAATYSPITSQAAVYYPPVTIADPTVGVGAITGAVKTVGAGASVVGIYAKTDATRGVFKAPAGLQARIAGAVSVTSLSSSDLDSLNAGTVPVNAIKYVPGSGIVVYGARTLKQGYVDRYVPIRRTLIYLEKSLKDLTAYAVFEPNDQRLWDSLEATCNAFLNSFWSQGGLSGTDPSSAFFVKCDADLNPQTAIDNGYVNIQVGVALQRPAEYVVINIGQYSGGTTVTIA